MMRDHFKVLVVHLDTGRGTILNLEGRDRVAGGSGLAAFLFEKYAHVDRPWDDPDQPLIFAIGPLTGLYPLMTKTVCAFKSPYHDQYAESHAGGRSGLCLRFADLDGLVILGKASGPSCLIIGSRHLELKDVHYLWGMDVQATGKMLRRMVHGGGHRSILRIGPAGERRSPMACINADTYRHFGRLGGGGVMGSKKLKAIIVIGDRVLPIPEDKEYPRLVQEVHRQVTDTNMMSKYHDLGTPINVAVLNDLKALPCRNLQRTDDPDIQGITGENFAARALLRNVACAGCPVGCIHVGFVRERFMEENQYIYRQVSYDHEPIFASGSMLGVTDCFAVLSLIDMAEKMGLDVMSAGVALAWATEALEKGLISEGETLVPLRFGDTAAYLQAYRHLGNGTNEFYTLLSQGTGKAVQRYGGADFACVLGQEMAGYATGEVFFISQALGLRHSHLDAGGYSYDQKSVPPDAAKAVGFLVQDERERVFLTSMVACLFARGVYTRALLSRCLEVVGYKNLAADIDTVSVEIQRLRWKMRCSTGFDPHSVSIPKRFREISTWKGSPDPAYMKALQDTYAAEIINMSS